MANDYMPRSDGEFDNWSDIFLNILSNVLTETGITAAELAAVQALQTEWQGRYETHRHAQVTAAAAAGAKNDARAEFEGFLRKLVARVQAAPGTTDDIRRQLLIPVYDATRTAAPVPDAPPMLKVDTSRRFEHTISFFQPTPDGKGSRAKPKGAKACAIYRKLGAPPTLVNGRPTDMEFLAADTASPYVIAYGSAEAGQTAYYMACWIGGPTGSDAGPWSETVEATVVG